MEVGRESKDDGTVGEIFHGSCKKTIDSIVLISYCIVGAGKKSYGFEEFHTLKNGLAITFT